jgi:hypothetical protein
LGQVIGFMGRLILGLVLAAAGIGLYFGAQSTFGAPWSFQDRHAVFLEVAGKAVLFPADPKKHDPTGQSRTINPAAGGPIYLGDELRLSGMAFARVRFPEGVVEMSDGARLVINDSGNLVLGRGLFRLVKKAGQAGNWSVRLGQGGTSVVVADGSCTVQANGSGHAVLVSHEGRQSLSANRSSPLIVKAGQIANVDPGEEPALTEAPGELTLKAKVKKRRSVSEVSNLKGEVSHLSAIYVDGELVYPDADGKFTLPLPPGSVDLKVVARDAFGKSALTEVKRPKGS